MHKYSKSKNNLGQIDQSKHTSKELETVYVKPLRAAQGFTDLQKGGNCSRVFSVRNFIGQPLVVVWL